MLTGSTGQWMSLLSAWALYRNTMRFAVALFAGVAAEVPPVTPAIDEGTLAVSDEMLSIRITIPTQEAPSESKV
jgi:hypothetical protein